MSNSNDPEVLSEEVSAMQKENAKRREASSTFEHDAFPDSYIKAKWLKSRGMAISMAGFEMGDPTPSLVKDPVTGKKRLKVTLNGYLPIERDGSCLILDTLFNRLKLLKLCRPGSLKMPKNSKGTEHRVLETKPDFMVEDESIFDGLDPEADAAVAAKRSGNLSKPKLQKGSKSLVSVDEVDAKKRTEEAGKVDLDPERGARARPETSEPDGGLKLDMEP
jgi:hypothetical protein